MLKLVAVLGLHLSSINAAVSHCVPTLSTHRCSVFGTGLSRWFLGCSAHFSKFCFSPCCGCTLFSEGVRAAQRPPPPLNSVSDLMNIIWYGKLGRVFAAALPDLIFSRLHMEGRGAVHCCLKLRFFSEKFRCFHPEEFRVTTRKRHFERFSQRNNKKKKLSHEL